MSKMPKHLIKNQSVLDAPIFEQPKKHKALQNTEIPQKRLQEVKDYSVPEPLIAKCSACGNLSIIADEINMLCTSCKVEDEAKKAKNVIDA